MKGKGVGRRSHGFRYGLVGLVFGSHSDDVVLR